MPSGGRGELGLRAARFKVKAEPRPLCAAPLTIRLHQAGGSATPAAASGASDRPAAAARRSPIDRRPRKSISDRLTAPDLTEAAAGM